MTISCEEKKTNLCQGRNIIHTSVNSALIVSGVYYIIIRLRGALFLLQS